MNHQSQALSLGALRSALSPERLKAYESPEDRDELDSVSRYLWNGALSCAMQPALHALEVTFRNNLYNASLRVIDQTNLTYKEIPCWLDADPPLLFEKELASVEEAKEVLKRAKKPLTPGRLIAKLSFGFWVALCRAPYEQGRESGPGLWPKVLNVAFPSAPKGHRTRSAIRIRFDEIKELRNRVFHYEPIWDRDLEKAHRRTLAAVRWMNPGMAEAVDRISQVNALEAGGPAAFRGMAEDLVRV